MSQNCSVSLILQNIIFVFGRTNTFIQVWHYSRMSKWWHSFHVWVNYPFKLSFPPDFNAFWTFPLTGLQGTWAVPRVLRSQFPSWWSLCVRWRWRSPPRTTADPWTNTRSREWRPRTGPGDTRLPSVLRERKITLVSWREWSGLHIKHSSVWDLIPVSEVLVQRCHYTPHHSSRSYLQLVLLTVDDDRRDLLVHEDEDGDQKSR